MDTVSERLRLQPKLYPVDSLRSRFQRIFDANARFWMQCVLMFSDMVCLLTAILIGLQLRRLSGITLDIYYKGVFLLLACMLLISFTRKGLYPAIGMHYIDELRDIMSSTGFTFLIIVGVTFLLKTTSTYSRLLLIFIWIISSILIPANRYLIRRIMIRLSVWGEPVAVIGSSNKELEMSKYFSINLQMGLRPAVLLKDQFLSDNSIDTHLLLSLEEIEECANHLSLKTALIAVHDLNHLDVLVERYRMIFQRVILIKERNGSYILNNLKSLDLSEMLGWQVKNNLLDSWAQLSKRFIDMLISAAGLLFLSPLLGLIAILIKLESPGSIMYRQTRLGKNSVIFDFLKFRTMYQDSDYILREKLNADPVLQSEWDRYQKLKDDPRITRIGRILRRFSLDELPQLWNVLKGEMSLVGPRPMMVEQCNLYGQSIRSYIQVLPGITGLWQVSGRNKTTFIRRAELDAEYIQRWSPWMDIFILAKTLKVVLFQEGSY